MSNQDKPQPQQDGASLKRFTADDFFDLIESTIDMDDASPIDWINETLAIIESGKSGWNALTKKEGA